MIASTQTNHPLPDSVETVVGDGSRLALACDRLRKAGLRITQPRIAILNTLIRGAQPVSIEKIHGQLEPEVCDLVTVYRCLGAFEDIGIVRRSFLLNGTSLYQLSDLNEPVYHIVSKETDDIQALDTTSSSRLAKLIHEVEQELRDRGFENVTHVLGFFATNMSNAATPSSRRNLGPTARR